MLWFIWEKKGLSPLGKTLSITRDSEMKNKLHLYMGNLRDSGQLFFSAALFCQLPLALDAGGSMDFAIYKKI